MGKRQPPQPIPVLAPILLLFVLLVFSVIALVLAVSRLNLSKDARGWPTVDGAVLHATQDRKKSSDGKSQIRTRIIYRYAVEGKSYERDSISPEQGWTEILFSRNNEWLRRFEEGKGVQVYTNPEEPGQSFLDPELTWRSHIWFAVPVLAVLIGGVVIVFVRKHNRQLNSA